MGAVYPSISHRNIYLQLGMFVNLFSLFLHEYDLILTIGPETR